MEILQEETSEYSFKASYYPKVPSLVDGTFNGRYSFFRDTETSRLCDKLVDHYSKEQRLFAWRRNGSSAPKKEKDGVIVEGDEKGEAKAFCIARAWTYISMITGRTNFRGLKWCDMSAGWGVHLLTALMTGMEYFSCDPNKRMTPVYRRMISDFNAEDRAIVHESGFEGMQVKEAYYDIFFSSPPYFDWEVYSDDEDQSIKKFPGFITWCARFLIPCVQNGIKCLKPGGSMMLHMEDLKAIRYCEMVVMYIRDNHPEMHFEGIIACGGKTKHIPTFIWKKITVPREASSYLSHYYKQVFDNLPIQWIDNESNPPYEVILTLPIKEDMNQNIRHMKDASVYRGMWIHFMQCECKNMIYFGSDEFEVGAFLANCKKKKRTPIIYFIAYSKYMENKMGKRYRSLGEDYHVLRIHEYSKEERSERIQSYRSTIPEIEDSIVIDFAKDISYIQSMTRSFYKIISYWPPFRVVWITIDHLDVLRALCDVTTQHLSILSDKYEPCRFMLLKPFKHPLKYYPSTFKSSDVERITYIELGKDDVNPLQYAIDATKNISYVKMVRNPHGEMEKKSIPKDIFWEVVLEP